MNKTFRAKVSERQKMNVSKIYTESSEFILRRSLSRMKGKIATVSKKVPKAAWNKNMTKNL